MNAKSYSQERTLPAPPSIALALMVAKKIGFARGDEPAPRAEIHCGLCYPKSTLYYETIDRIAGVRR